MKKNDSAKGQKESLLLKVRSIRQLTSQEMNLAVGGNASTITSSSIECRCNQLGPGGGSQLVQPPP